jgi:hypothetical protein
MMFTSIMLPVQDGEGKWKRKKKHEEPNRQINGFRIQDQYVRSNLPLNNSQAASKVAGKAPENESYSIRYSTRRDQERFLYSTRDAVMYPMGGDTLSMYLHMQWSQAPDNNQG